MLSVLVILLDLVLALRNPPSDSDVSAVYEQLTFRPQYYFRRPNKVLEQDQKIQLLSQTSLITLLAQKHPEEAAGFRVSQYRSTHISSSTVLDQQDYRNSQTPVGLAVGERAIVPNTTDKETIVNLAKMTSDAYILDPFGPDWLNTSLGFNVTDRFGWEGDGLRGQVFSTEDNSTVVIAFKGTSVDPRDPWRNNDRLNDNLLFSCCCGAQNPWGYAPVCDCQRAAYECNQTCVQQSLIQQQVYYSAAIEVVQNITSIFPNSTFWLVGHSLGGALASLVGLTLDLPAVSFESPPEQLPAERLGLQPSKSRRSMAHHFGNTADPIFMGACNGFFSSCSSFGFSFESQCFSGKRCVYDTVMDKGWRMSIGNHRINYVIENVLKAYDTVPKCEPDDECKDCYLWKY